MTTQSVIPIPADDTTFEQNIAVLFRGILGDPNTKRVAKSGKNQKGIDVFGRAASMTRPDVSRVP